MAKIINIKCIQCKEEFTTEPYFCNTDVYYRDDGFNNHSYHVARTIAKAICPYCGETNAQVCENEIFRDDIIDLAIRRYKRNDAFFEGYHK
jgi:hypothetical protein